MIRKSIYIFLVVAPALINAYVYKAKLPDYSLAAYVFVALAIVSFVVGFFALKKEKGIAYILIIFSIFNLVSLFLIRNVARTIVFADDQDKVKTDLSEVLTQAAVVRHDSPSGSYEAVCADKKVQAFLTSAKSGTASTKCFNGVDSFVVAAAFKKPRADSTHYCVDSTGFADLITTVQYDMVTSAATLCKS